MRRVGALLLIGGEGRRFGGGLPKQFRLLGGKKVYVHALERLQRVRLFDEIVLVCHADWLHLVNENVRVVKGGATRQLSCLAGLKAFEEAPDVVLIHDGVRPFVSEEILRENVRGAIEHGAVDTCIPCTDTIVHAPGGGVISTIPKRSEYLRGQTPQTFRYDWLLEAHEKAEGVDASDDCTLVMRLGKQIHVVEGEERNMKITSELDLLIAEKLMEN